MLGMDPLSHSDSKSHDGVVQGEFYIYGIPNKRHATHIPVDSRRSPGFPQVLPPGCALPFGCTVGTPSNQEFQQHREPLTHLLVGVNQQSQCRSLPATPFQPCPSMPIQIDSALLELDSLRFEYRCHQAGQTAGLAAANRSRESMHLGI